MKVIEYLKNPPSRETLSTLIKKLNIEPQDLVRTEEDDFKAAGVDLSAATNDRIIDLMTTYPRLIQRPIVELAHTARIGRPPESVLELFE